MNTEAKEFTEVLLLLLALIVGAAIGAEMQENFLTKKIDPRFCGEIVVPLRGIPMQEAFPNAKGIEDFNTSAEVLK